MEVDGTVILTNFVPSDAATIGDGFTERKREREEGSGEGGRKEVARLSIWGSADCICRVLTMTNDVRNLHHWHRALQVRDKVGR